MYYEKKLINGVLMCRSTPTGNWLQVSIEWMSERLVKAEAKVVELENELLGNNSKGLGAK